ncbi:rhodanese-like domain-containing protein [uncultured Meiothermus sp.]|jgi:rhodanese-related sulfurtransferase|uniref:rhodanese-like domain-containing protein n=1 Tax=uncultured Meiothermus sp. TaxID=157471 RepID=UPI002601919D|nr:rhodanese-like domain-containing protein [uncultured Meiothermus sp.]
MQDLFPNELSLWQKRGALLLDVREQGEFESARIPHSRNVPLGQLLEHLDSLQGPIVTLCASGSRAGLAAEVLEYEGIEVARLVGGIQGYAAQGYTLERPTKPASNEDSGQPSPQLAVEIPAPGKSALPETGFKPEDAPCS